MSNTDSGSKRGVYCRDITILYIAFWQRISLYIIQHKSYPILILIIESVN
jgi:hypothetical protein